MELLPCPFCGTTTVHKDDCYFVLLALRSDERRLHEAWNRRASPASVPEGQKPVASVFADEDCTKFIAKNMSHLRPMAKWWDLYIAPQAAAPTTPVSEDRWQPIETAPKDGTRVLIVNDDGEIDVAGYVEEWHERSEFVRKAKDGDVYRTVRDDCGYWDTDRAYCPTHWMPLPKAPAMQEDKP